MAEQKNLTLRVYDNIKQMMINYDIVPGQRLVFVDLAKELGVSRTPVNNALSILAKEGYLDFIPNQGYSVHKLTRKEAESLYEIKLFMELGSIENAIKLATPKKLAALEEKKNQYASSVKGHIYRHLFALDMEFHAAIGEMVNNTYFVEIYKDIYQRIFLRFRTEHLETPRLFKNIEEHENLYKAIVAKNVKAAKKLIKEHSDFSMANLFPIIFD
jgi:DNA-binding GntR family transcriptional regulator